MTQEITRQLQTIRSAGKDHLVSAAMVRAGTSRIIVADGRTAPEGMTHEELSYHLLGHGDPSNGLGGEHYQLNKVAIWRPAEPPFIDFHFFNLDPGEQKMVMGAECGHAAAAVGMVAGLEEPEQFDPSLIRVRNADTRQIIDFKTHVPERFWNAPCTINLHAEDQDIPPHRDEMHIDGGGDVLWHVVHHGNSFALVQGFEATESPEVRRHIESHTIEHAREVGRRNIGPEFVRVIPHTAEWESRTHARVQACCWNGEEKHKSLPVSGAIALCDFLACRQCSNDPSSDTKECTYTFTIDSPTSSEPGSVHMIRSGASWSIVWSGYDTFVRLLVACEIVVPR